MHEHAVVIVGAGPTGLMLAAELALAGTDFVLLERRHRREFAGSRAGGLHARTLEVFDQRGIAERFLAEGRIAQVAAFGGVTLDLSDFPTRHNYGLALWQLHTERILGDWVSELGVQIRFDAEVTGVAQDETGVDVVLADGSTVRARWVVGCDGGRSKVRSAADIDFPGWDPSTSWLMAEVRMRAAPPLGFRHTPRGSHAIGMSSDDTFSVVLERPSVPAGEPTLDELRATLEEIYGTDFGVHDPVRMTRFNDATRQAARYRNGRVLLAGDAAHVHPPMGGQGLNIGVQDAVNLGWKLTQVVKGTSRQDLLDTYHAERHPVAARVLRTTMAQVAVRRQDDRSKALAEVVTDLLGMEQPRKRYAAMMSGLDIRYDLGEGHPLLGRRIPDLDLTTQRGPTRVFSLLHDARPVLLNFASPDEIDVSRWASAHVKSIAAGVDGDAWELPVIGPVTPPDAVLVRPDGYVAWVGDAQRIGLEEALTTWVGTPDQ